MASAGITRFARVAKGATDDVALVPRVQPIVIGKAVVTKVDLAQNVCFVTLADGTPAGPLRLKYGCTPAVNQTVQTELDSPVMTVASVLSVPDQYTVVT